MNSKKIASELARELAIVRKKKIKKLKARISSGSYKVNNSTLAKSMFIPR